MASQGKTRFGYSLRFILPPAVLVLALGCSQRSPAAADPDSLRVAGTVTRVADGDSFDMKLPAGIVAVRLHAIDAPERGQPYGQNAYAALNSRIAGRTIEIQVVERDQYGRQVAVAYVDGRNLNAELVASGHAWVYRQYVTDPQLCHLEAQARTRKVGIWALPAVDQVAPWDWRNRARGKAMPIRDSDDLDDCIAAIAVRESPTLDAGCRIKGNISDAGRLYHVPGSRDYERTRIEPARGERWFCSEEEARAQGWRRAGSSPR